MRVTWGSLQTTDTWPSPPDILISLAWPRTWTSGFEKPHPTPRWCYSAEWPEGTRREARRDLQVIWWEPKYKRNRPKSGSRQSLYRGAEAIISTRRQVLGLVTVLQEWWSLNAWVQAWGFLMMVRDATTSVRQLVLGTLETFLPSGLPPGVRDPCLPCSSSLLPVSIFLYPTSLEPIHPPCLTHLLFPLSFSPPCQLPGPLTPVSSPCSLSSSTNTLVSPFLFQFSCFSILHLDSQSPTLSNWRSLSSCHL